MFDSTDLTLIECIRHDLKNNHKHKGARHSSLTKTMFIELFTDGSSPTQSHAFMAVSSSLTHYRFINEGVFAIQLKNVINKLNDYIKQQIEPDGTPRYQFSFQTNRSNVLVISDSVVVNFEMTGLLSSILMQYREKH